MIETIILGTLAFLLILFAICAMVVSVYLITRVAPLTAQIKADADVRKTRVEARADLAMDQGDFNEADDQNTEDGGFMGSLNGIARVLGYSDAMSAMSDPKIMAKLGISKPETTTTKEEETYNNA